MEHLNYVDTPSKCFSRYVILNELLLLDRHFQCRSKVCYLSEERFQFLRKL